ncbi:hypothetical protein P7C73_g6290, partial [Tremellales sp. Uapishka_1]
LLYISKADSTGYAPSPLPLTRLLLVSFLRYFVQTIPTLRIHLFARSQNQYLFPNSIAGGKKKVLGGIGLCRWWKGVYEDVVEAAAAGPTETQTDIQLGFLLPSYDEAEARGLLGSSRSRTEDRWAYRPPFHDDPAELEGVSLAQLIPSLPDDPKTRFLEELVVESAGPSLVPKKKDKEKEKLDPKEVRKEHLLLAREHAKAALDKLRPAEFWERMAFRQECISGDVTGFFSLLSTHPTRTAGTSITLAPPPTSTQTQAYFSPGIMERFLKTLLNLDFGSREIAVDSTRLWEKSVAGIAKDEMGDEVFQRCCVGIVEKKDGVAEEKGDAKREREKDVEAVTMLQPRKKKKP